MGEPKTLTKQSTAPYTEHYKQECRKAWYVAGRPDSRYKIAEVVPPDQDGRHPDALTLSYWRDEMGWDVWADALDAKAEAIVDDELVNERVLMLKRQAGWGKEMGDKGINYLREHDFDTSASAVSAIVKGVEMERTSRGISERLINLLKMDDESLTREAVQLLGRGKDSGEVLDIPTEDIEEDGED